MLNEFLNSANGGNTISPRYLGPLAADADNISSDDQAVKSTPQGITDVKNTAVRQSLNQSWSSMDLNAALYGTDPLIAIRDQIAKYWTTRRQRRTILSMQGVIASNIANNGGDSHADARVAAVQRGKTTRSEDSQADHIALLAAATRGLKGLVENGKDVPFSEKEARRIYGQYPCLAEQVGTFITDRALIFCKPDL